MGDWRVVLESGQLSEGGMKGVRCDGESILLARVAGEVRAVEGRCPHEGYPLATGDLDGCRLTCAWHNWKFDLRDGSCLLGGEGLRTYLVRERSGSIEVDVTPPSREEAIPSLLAGLAEGIGRRDTSRALRDSVRLIQAGLSSRRVMQELVAIDARYADYGNSHVAGLATDCARLFDRYDNEEGIYPLAPVIDLACQSVALHQLRSTGTPQPGGLDELVAAVEREDVDGADSILVGGFAADVPLPELERWLFAALSNHFTDFGHQLIYWVKLRALMDDAPRDVARDAYRGLLRGTVLATREDLLPYMKIYQTGIAQVEGEFDDWNRREPTPETRLDSARWRDEIVEALLVGRPAASIAVVADALRIGVELDEVARSVVAAAAHRLLRFDPAIDADPEVAENWLWATHRFTYASAARQGVAATNHVGRIRQLFLAAAFVNQGRAMDHASSQIARLVPIESDLDGLVRAVEGQQRDEAVGRAAYLLGFDPASLRIASSEEPDDFTRSTGGSSGSTVVDGDHAAIALRSRLEETSLRDPRVRPIHHAHFIKTLWAGFDERDAFASGDPDRDIGLLGALRYVASPSCERRLYDAAKVALEFVRDGKMQKKLTQ